MNYERYNFLWKTNITEEEYENVITDNPMILVSYMEQEKLAAKLLNKTQDGTR